MNITLNYFFFYRIYKAVVRSYYPEFTEDQIVDLKEKEFSCWLQYYVSYKRKFKNFGGNLYIN